MRCSTKVWWLCAPTPASPWRLDQGNLRQPLVLRRKLLEGVGVNVAAEFSGQDGGHGVGVAGGLCGVQEEQPAASC